MANNVTGALLSVKRLEESLKKICYKNSQVYVTSFLHSLPNEARISFQYGCYILDFWKMKGDKANTFIENAFLNNPLIIYFIFSFASKFETNVEFDDKRKHAEKEGLVIVE